MSRYSRPIASGFTWRSGGVRGDSEEEEEEVEDEVGIDHDGKMGEDKSRAESVGVTRLPQQLCLRIHRPHPAGARKEMTVTTDRTQVSLLVWGFAYTFCL